MVKFLNYLRSWQKLFIIISYDIFVMIVSIWASFSLRFLDLFPFDGHQTTFYISLLGVSIIQIVSFYTNGLYKGMWRYTSIPDLFKIIKAVTISIAFSLLFVFIYNRGDEFPRTVFVIDWFFLIFGLSAGRVIYRYLIETTHQYDSTVRKVAIWGAGIRGETLLRELKRSMQKEVRVVCYFDDDLSKTNRTIHGVRVVGGFSRFELMIQKLNIKEVYLAIPEGEIKKIEQIVIVCKKFNIEIKKLPMLEDLIKGNISTLQLRSVSADQLLSREAINLDNHEVKKFISGKTILVSGAGGSIGSELSRQILKHGPEKLIALDCSELATYQLEKQLSKEFPKHKVEFMIADVRDISQLNAVLKPFKINSIFHAAAYKHVPLMEDNPEQSIMTNIIGTRNLVNFSSENDIDKFVLVSTDKAVNPTNVMGATKRIAEMICSLEATKSKTKFITVRFGNVLDSSGSVIPLFKKQISKGGPVTVTHPDVERFFMSIPEASSLVIKAAANGKGGEIFVLDMGSPVKIVDLAKQLISLSGLIPDKDIEIEFTGLRPGEKLYEELFSDNEKVLQTNFNKIQIAESRIITPDLDIKIKNLSEVIFKNLTKIQVMKKIKEIVPEYNLDLREVDSNELENNVIQ